MENASIKIKDCKIILSIASKGNDGSDIETDINIGEIKDEPVVIDGKVEIRKMCDFGVNLDERIADGFYFAKALKLFEYVINNPKELEEFANARIDTKQD